MLNVQSIRLFSVKGQGHLLTGFTCSPIRPVYFQSSTNLVQVLKHFWASVSLWLDISPKQLRRNPRHMDELPLMAPLDGKKRSEFQAKTLTGKKTHISLGRLWSNSIIYHQEEDKMWMSNK